MSERTSSRLQPSPWWAVGLTGLLAAISALLLAWLVFVVAADPMARPCCEHRVWGSPMRGVLGGATALAATGVGFLVAAKTRRGRIRPVFAVGLSVILGITVAVGGQYVVSSIDHACLCEVGLSHHASPSLHSSSCHLCGSGAARVTTRTRLA